MLLDSLSLPVLATMKKQSVAAASADADGGDGGAAAAGGGGGWRGGGGSDDEGEGGGFAAGGDEGGIAMERTYLNKLGDREKEVSAENRIKSFRYGKEQVPFSEEDLEQLKFKTEKVRAAALCIAFHLTSPRCSLDLLSAAGILDRVSKSCHSRRRRAFRDITTCQTSTGQEKRRSLEFSCHSLLGRLCSLLCCLFYLCSIVAEPGDFSSALQLSALIHACYDTAKVAVVRYVKRNNDRPLLGILLPVVKADVECFYFNQLPFVRQRKQPGCHCAAFCVRLSLSASLSMCVSRRRRTFVSSVSPVWTMSK